MAPSGRLASRQHSRSVFVAEGSQWSACYCRWIPTCCLLLLLEAMVLCKLRDIEKIGSYRSDCVVCIVPLDLYDTELHAVRV